MILRVVSDRVGDFVSQRWYACAADRWRLVGTLTLTIGEYQEIGAALLLGAGQMNGALRIVREGWSPDNDDDGPR